MTSDQKWSMLIALDEELLLGCAMLSEKTIFIVKDADIAFCAGADLAAITLCQAAIESHLKYEYGDMMQKSPKGFFDLIEMSPIKSELKARLHKLRIVRNSWVHVDPWEDTQLLENPDQLELEIENASLQAVTLLREVLYLEQGT